MKKRVLIFIGKTLLLTAVLTGLFYLWVVIVFSHGNLFGPTPPKENLIDFCSLILFSAGFIALTVWLSRLGVESKEDRKRMSFIGRLKTPFFQLLGVAAAVLLSFLIRPLKQAGRIIEANILYHTASDVVAYPSDSYNEDYLHTPAHSPVMLVNESGKKVTFLYGEYCGQLKKMKLKKECAGNQPDGLYVQYTAQLSSGGTVVTYFSFDPDSDKYDARLYRECTFTSGVELTDAGGNKWYAPIEPRDDLSFSALPEAQVNAAEALSDNVIQINRTVQLTSDVKGYDCPTLFVNTKSPDKIYLYILSDDPYREENTQYVEHARLAEASVSDSGNWLDTLYPAAIIDIPDTDITLYACRSSLLDNSNMIDKFAALKSDSTMYLSNRWDSVQAGFESGTYAVPQQMSMLEICRKQGVYGT